MERDEIIKRIDILIRGLSQPSTKINGSSEIGIVRAEVEEEDKNQREHQPSAAAGENFRQCCRQHDPDHALCRRQAHGRARPQHFFLHSLSTLKAVIDHGKADAEKDHKSLGDIADAKPEHDDRHERRLRHRIGDHQ